MWGSEKMNEPKKIYALTKKAGIEFGMYHEEGVYFITDNKKAADILSTAGCTIEEWSLVTVEEATELKELYDRMKRYDAESRESDEEKDGNE